MANRLSGGNIMISDERATDIYHIAERFEKLCEQAYEVYLPLVENICIKEASEDEVEHLLDYLMDFAHDEQIFELFKSLTI